MNVVDIDELIGRAQRGDIEPLVERLRGKPMSPTGFEKNGHGLSFGDGYMEDRSWLAVESAVMDGELDEDVYSKVKDGVYGRSADGAP